MQEVYELRWIPLFDSPWEWCDDRHTFEVADFSHRYPKRGRTLRLDCQFTPMWVPGELLFWDALHARCWSDVSLHNVHLVPVF